MQILLFCIIWNTFLERLSTFHTYIRSNMERVPLKLTNTQEIFRKF